MSVFDKSPWRKVWLGLGGNIGDVQNNMVLALSILIKQGHVVCDVSSLYKTPPWGNLEQPWFYNCCAMLKTKLAPDMFLDACLGVEKALKRERLVHWGPRTIDIDVLSFEGVSSFESDHLTLPHPRISERCFVLVPLSEIAPNLFIGDERVGDMVQKCACEEIEKVSNGDEWFKRGQ